MDGHLIVQSLIDLREWEEGDVHAEEHDTDVTHAVLIFELMVGSYRIVDSLSSRWPCA